MINSTRCAFMAKQACATFSKVVQKITPPIANNFLKFFFALFATLTLNAATAWAETTTYTVSASSGKLSNWSGSIGTAYNDGSVKFDTSGDNYSNAAIWSGEVSTGMTKLAVTISYKLNGTSSNQNVFTVSVVNSSGTAIVSKTFAPTATSKTDVTLTFDNLSGSPTGLKMVYTTKKSGNVGVYKVSATATYSTTPPCTEPTIATQPTGATYTTGATATALKVVASGDDLTYQWYSNTSNSTSGATKISGATSSTYTPSTSTVGTKYYYCIVSSGSCSTTSNIVSVVVKNPPFTVTLVPGSGSVTSTTLTETSAGAGVTLPTPTLDCGDWEFAGWKTTSAVATEITTKPTLIPAGAYNPASNITLYAVYQRTEDGVGSSTPTNVTKVYSGANDADLKFSTGSSSNNLVNNDGYTAGNVNVKFTTGTNSNNSYYDGSVVRFYAGSSLIVTPLNDVTITQVEFVRSTSTSSNTGTISTDQLTASQSNSTTNINVFTGSATSAVTFKNSAQCRFSVLRITYTSSSGTTTTTYYHSTPECTTETSYSVIYNGNGNTSGSVPTDATEYAEDAQVTVLGNTGNLAKTGYTFSGWNTEANGTGTTTYAEGDKFTITKNTTLYAQWKANTYTITLNTNGGTINSGAISSYTYGVGATLPTDVTKTGYTFAGWYNNSDFTGNPIKTIGTTETGNKEFWAKWTPAVYTITYKDQGNVAFSGTHEEGYPTTHTYNTATTLKSASKDHYTFDGWYKESDCSGTKVTTLGATEYTDNITLYAKWTANTYKITFNAGTGTCGTEFATATNADGITLPTATPSDACTDWTFAGWAEISVTETTTKPTLLKANDKYQPTSDIILYAVYSQTETTLGEGEELSQTLKYDSWSYTGSTTNKGDYRMFHKDSYVESAPFDLSILTKVVVYGGTFGGDQYNSLTIGDGTKVWKTVTVTGNSQTGQNTFTDGEALSGIGNLRIISNSGKESTNGVRISKIEIYTVSSITTTTYNSNPTCIPPAKYTITWWANGEEYRSQTAAEGTAIEVPTTSPEAATYACDDKVFVGWIEKEIDEATDEEPTLITDFDKITENKDFFAVFATVETISEGVTASLTKMTDADDFAAGDKVVIIAEDTRLGLYQRTSIADYVDYWTVSSSDGVPTLEEIDADAKRYFDVTTGTSDGTWKLGDAETGYLYNSESTNLQISRANSSDWTLIGFTDGTFTLKAGQYLSCRTDLESDRKNKWRGAGKNCDCESGDGCTGNIYYNIYKYVKGSSATTTYSGYVTTCEATTEALSGKFSTGKYEYAEFATGNLQYKPSTDTWRFAKQQYQVVGEDNINIGDPNYKGWIDMLGWSTNDENNNYGVNPSCNKDLYTGDFKDWGTKMGKGWLTLTETQWNYLLNERPNHSTLKQIAMVGDTRGIMLFPDDWTGTTVKATDDAELGVKVYKYDLSQWAALESAGAVFLPAAGRRFGGYDNTYGVDGVTNKGEEYKIQYKTNYFACYWTSTKHSDGERVSYLFNYAVNGSSYKYSNLNLGWYEYGHAGHSVRLAKVTNTLIQLGSGNNSAVITENAGKIVNVQVNRTFKANDGYYTICLPFDLDAEKIGKALQISSITENVAEQGMNVVFTEVTNLVAGQPYLVLPSENLTNPIFEGVTIDNTTGKTTEPVFGAGIKITLTGIINGGGQTDGSTEYYVGDYGYLYNGQTDKLGLRAFFTITDDADQPVKVRARVVVGENTTTGVDNSQLPITNIQKVIENGQLIIIRNGEKYNIQGQKL